MTGVGTLEPPPPPPIIPPPPMGTQAALEPEPDNLYPELQVKAPQVGKELYVAVFDNAAHKLVHAAVVEGIIVYAPEAVGSVK